jgi:hypothetical protein
MQTRIKFEGKDQVLEAHRGSSKRPSKKQVKCHHNEMGAV